MPSQTEEKEKERESEKILEALTLASSHGAQHHKGKWEIGTNAGQTGARENIIKGNSL